MEAVGNCSSYVKKRRRERNNSITRYNRPLSMCRSGPNVVVSNSAGCFWTLDYWEYGPAWSMLTKSVATRSGKYVVRGNCPFMEIGGIESKVECAGAGAGKLNRTCC